MTGERLEVIDVPRSDYAREEHKWVTHYFNGQFEKLGPRPVEIQPSSVEPLRAVEEHRLTLNLTHSAKNLIEHQD